jgi:hypothetical protein
MPAKTIYVKESEIPIFEQVQEQVGDSISALFSEFLRERMANLHPDESRLLGLLARIQAKREALVEGSPVFLDLLYAEAEPYARKALEELHASRVRESKIAFWAANQYLELADRTARQTNEIGDKVSELSRSAT